METPRTDVDKKFLRSEIDRANPQKNTSATDVVQEIYTAVAKPEEILPAAPSPITGVVKKDSEPTKNDRNYRNPKPTEVRRVPQRSEPLPKVRHAGVG